MSGCPPRRPRGRNCSSSTTIFGLNEAIAFHAETHSYAVQLAPGWRMLALNDDGDGRAFCGYSEDQLHWILDQVKLAHEAGERCSP